MYNITSGNNIIMEFISVTKATVLHLGKYYYGIYLCNKSYCFCFSWEDVIQPAVLPLAVADLMTFLVVLAVM